MDATLTIFYLIKFNLNKKQIHPEINSLWWNTSFGMYMFVLVLPVTCSHTLLLTYILFTLKHCHPYAPECSIHIHPFTKRCCNLCKTCIQCNEFKDMNISCAMAVKCVSYLQCILLSLTFSSSLARKSIMASCDVDRIVQKKSLRKSNTYWISKKVTIEYLLILRWQLLS